ncbi:hypothetical protein ABW19_dt0206833 [Dactylella cylindrospora]|nr:hypothetical protein ABW19_dt0206833 [Dactylella cylindrospora]
MNTFRIIKTAVTDVATTQPGARIGVLQLSKGFTLQTPNFLTPTSRGVVPHLSPDNLEKNTGVIGVYVALEDFIEKAPQRVPPLYKYTGPIRDFISLPSANFIILSPRRSPSIATPKPNSDANFSIYTSVGFRELPIKDYVASVVKLHPDIVISPCDIPNVENPGKNRVRKMGDRTERWLDELLGRVFGGTDAEERHKPAVFASILPLEKERQRLYLEYLIDHVERISGLVLPENEYTIELPEELQGLPKLTPDISSGPHEILDHVDAGIDMFNVNFPILAADAGIVLHFRFGGADPSDTGGVPLEQLDLGTDMWNEKFATDLSPLEEGCDCYACKKHHKAYIQHCLAAKEMTAWVLLQIHNLKVVERFFGAVRRSIEEGKWEADKEEFRRRYKRELPEKTGAGPR